MNIHVYGIKIKTRVTGSDLSIGFYSVSGANSELRFIQNTVSGVTDWRSGRLAINGIGKYSRSIDLIDGGNIADPGSLSFKIINTDNYQASLDTYNIKLSGCIVELWKWDGDPDTVVPEILWIGRCKEPEIDTQYIKINAVGVSSGRVSNILQLVNATDYQLASNDLINNPIPVTFGKLFPSYDDNGLSTSNVSAKYVRVEDYVDTDMYTNATMTTEGLYSDIKIFPLYVKRSVNEYAITLNGTPKSISIGSYVYLKVITGDGSGQIRRVTGMSILSDPGYCTLYIESAFKTELSYANDDTRSWVQVINLTYKYAGDFWPLKAFLENTSGNEIDDPELYIDDNDDLLEIAQFSLSALDSNKNVLEVKGNQYSSDFNNVDSFKIFPITELSYIDDDDLTNYGLPSLDLSGLLKFQRGSWYGHPGTYLQISIGDDPTNYVDVNCSESTGDPNDSGFTGDLGTNSFDKDVTTSTEVEVYIDFPYFLVSYYDFNIALAIRGTLPKLSKNINIDDVYIGIKLNAHVIAGLNATVEIDSRVIVLLKRFIHTKTTDCILDDQLIVNKRDYTHILDDIPSFYATGTTGSDGKFYQETNTTGADTRTVNGYTLFKIGDGITIDEYNSYTEFALLIIRNVNISNMTGGVLNYSDTINLYEVAIIVKTGEATIDKEIYVPVSGRVFNDTWSGRVSASSLIQRPKDIFEHACRLQNFSESCSIPTAGWGYAYAPSPLICVDNDYDGSFDAVAFETYGDNALLPARQIVSSDDAYTDKIKLSLCKTFGWISWVSANGEEKLSSMLWPYNAAGVIDLITFGDVIDRNSIMISNWPSEKIYPNMSIFYDEDPITGECKRNISITNSESTSYTSSYVSGITSAAEAESLWNTAHSIYLQTENATIDKLPTNVSKIEWANGDGGYDIAKKYVSNMYELYRRKILEFNVHDQLVSTWEEGHWFKFSSPKHTSGVDKYCMVIGIEHDPNDPNVASVKALLMP